MDFNNHRAGCAKCRTVEIGKPATLVNCCHEGAPLLRDYLADLVKPEIARQKKQLKREFMQESDGKVYTTTKKKLKEVMRYK